MLFVLIGRRYQQPRWKFAIYCLGGLALFGVSYILERSWSLPPWSHAGVMGGYLLGTSLMRALIGEVR